MDKDLVELLAEHKIDVVITYIANLISSKKLWLLFAVKWLQMIDD